jgi:hypothetical protein
VLHAMQGRIDESRMLHAEADCIVDDLGSRWLSAIRCSVNGKSLLAGAPERAEADARASLELFQQMSATNRGSTAAALLAVALVQQNRHKEALHYADLAANWAAPDDMASQVGQLRARARVLAARGEFEPAEGRLAKQSDSPSAPTTFRSAETPSSISAPC